MVDARADLSRLNGRELFERIVQIHWQFLHTPEEIFIKEASQLYTSRASPQAET